MEEDTEALDILYRDRRAADVLRLIAESALLTESVLNEVAGASGIQRVDVRILGWLWIRGPLSLSELGQLSDLSKAGMTSASTRLLDAGLIMLRRDPADRRKTIVTLGDVLPKPLMDRMHRVAAELFGRLGGQPVQHARAVLAFFQAAADALKHAEPPNDPSSTDDTG